MSRTKGKRECKKLRQRRTRRVLDGIGDGLKRIGSKKLHSFHYGAGLVKSIAKEHLKPENDNDSI